MNVEIRNKRKEILKESVELQNIALSCDSSDKSMEIRKIQDEKYKKFDKAVQ